MNSPCENRKVERRRIIRASQRIGMVFGRAVGKMEHDDASWSRPTLGGRGLPHDDHDTFAALPGEPDPWSPILRRPRNLTDVRHWPVYDGPHILCVVGQHIRGPT